MKPYGWPAIWSCWRMGKFLAAGEARDVAANPRVTAVADVLGYTVLAAGPRLVAVPPGGLRIGGGPVEFSMIVERVADMVGYSEIAGMIGNVRVRLPWTSDAARPGPGDRLIVHAARFSELHHQG